MGVLIHNTRRKNYYRSNYFDNINYSFVWFFSWFFYRNVSNIFIHPTILDKVCHHADKDHDYISACFMMKHKIEKDNNTDDISCDFDSRFQ